MEILTDVMSLLASAERLAGRQVPRGILPEKYDVRPRARGHVPRYELG